MGYGDIYPVNEEERMFAIASSSAPSAKVPRMNEAPPIPPPGTSLAFLAKAPRLAEKFKHLVRDPG